MHQNKSNLVRLIIIVATWPIFVLSSVASGQLMEYASQERTIQATLTGFADANAAAPDFGPWVASVSRGPTSASQNSGLLSAAMNASGSVNGEGGFVPSGVSAGFAESRFSVTFSVGGIRDFLISGTLSGASVGDGHTVQRIELTRSTGEVIYSFSHGAFGSSPFSSSGSLTPGAYKLVARASATGFGSSSGSPSGRSSGGYNVAFTVTPEPASLVFTAAALGLVSRWRRGGSFAAYAA